MIKIVTKLHDLGDKNFNPSSKFHETYDTLRHTADLSYHKNDTNKIMKRSKTLTKLIKNQISEFFNDSSYSQIPIDFVKVELDTQSLVWYTSPRNSGQNGTVFINLDKTLSKLKLPSLVCHEIVPGHHFHVEHIMSKSLQSQLFHAQVRILGWCM